MYSEFGSAHNIVESPETGYVYAVGLRSWKWNLATKVIGDKIQNKWPKACDGRLLPQCCFLWVCNSSLHGRILNSSVRGKVFSVEVEVEFETSGCKKIATNLWYRLEVIFLRPLVSNWLFIWANFWKEIQTSGLKLKHNRENLPLTEAN